MEKKNSLLRKSYRHWYDDGLGEITQGIQFLLIALYFWLQQLFQGKRTPTVILSVMMPLVIIGLVVSMRFVVNRLKERITYPRTGFVSYRQNNLQKRRRLLVRIAIGIAMGISIGILGFGLSSGSVAWSYVLIGVAFMAIYAYVALRVGLVRFYAVAGMGLIAGVILGVLHTPDAVGMAVLFVSFGLPSLIIGLVVLTRFLRAHPPIDLSVFEYEMNDTDVDDNAEEDVL